LPEERLDLGWGDLGHRAEYASRGLGRLRPKVSASQHDVLCPQYVQERTFTVTGLWAS
jgi:hypothetical protein